MSADAAADSSLEPELPASVFVQPSQPARQVMAAAVQRSASISSSKG